MTVVLVLYKILISGIEGFKILKRRTTNIKKKRINNEQIAKYNLHR